jgi:hypothetical protein
MVMDRTKMLEDRLEYDIVDGKFKGYPIIHRDTPVLGGVYLGSHQREAISVRVDENPALVDLYKTTKRRATRDGKVQRRLVIPAIYLSVKDIMPSDGGEVQKIIHNYGAQEDGLLPMDVFLNEGYGNCRHHAVTCGALAEMFKDEGHINGELSVDRNSMWNGGHAWFRYTTTADEVWILDVTQRYYGTLEESLGKARWLYFRDEQDKEMLDTIIAKRR